MADETLHVLRYLGNRVADAAQGAGIPRARVHLYGPPQGETSPDGQPFVVLSLQAGGASENAVNGRSVSSPVVLVKVVSGGDTFSVGTPLGGTRPMAVSAVLDRIQEALEHHRATISLPGGESCAVTVKAGAPVLYAENPATSGGARYLHQGRQWRVLIQPDQRDYGTTGD